MYMPLKKLILINTLVKSKFTNYNIIYTSVMYANCDVCHLRNDGKRNKKTSSSAALITVLRGLFISIKSQAC